MRGPVRNDFWGPRRVSKWFLQLANSSLSTSWTARRCSARSGQRCRMCDPLRDLHIYLKRARNHARGDSIASWFWRWCESKARQPDLQCAASLRDGAIGQPLLHLALRADMDEPRQRGGRPFTQLLRVFSPSAGEQIENEGLAAPEASAQDHACHGAGFTRAT